MSFPKNDLNKNDSTLQTLTEEIYKKNLELLSQRRRAEQLLYGISEAVYAVDKNLNITLFNHTCEKMLNVKAEDALAKSADRIIKLKRESDERIVSSDFCFTQDPEMLSLEGIILEAPSGKNYFVNVKTSIITEGVEDHECLVTMVDITKEKELEKAKDDFISITSHELRTPMSIIKSYLWMLSSERGGKLSPKQRGYVSKAANGTERMLDLINDMLNISRIEQGRIEISIEKTDIPSLLKETLSDFKIKTEEKHLNFVIDIADDIKEAYVDKKRMNEVLINLVGNSLKFTTKGGITVKAQKHQGNFIKIAVIDTGSGLTQDEIKRLFHKFGRLDNSYQTIAETGGTGLGLYIVKLIVEAMGGEVFAESEGKGKGSVFWFTIPTTNILEQ